MEVEVSGRQRLQLGSLPALTQCILGVQPEAELDLDAPPVEMSAAAKLTLGTRCFAKAPSLEELRVMGNRWRVVLQPGCLNACTGLTHLTLDGSALTQLPPALSGVAATLKRLSLIYNRQLEFSAAAVELLLQFPALGELHCFPSSPSDAEGTVCQERTIADWAHILCERSSFKYGRALLFTDDAALW